MGTKREKCRAQLEKRRGRRPELESFLLKNCGLPGPRGDIELAGALSDMFYREEAFGPEKAMLREWLALTPDEAPVNSKREYLVFCAVQTLGVEYLQATEEERAGVFERIRAASRDPRWRTREAACFAFQRIAEEDFDELQRMFLWWLKRANMMDERAIIASLAHPPALTSEERVAFCLEAADAAMRHLEKLPLSGRKTEEYRILRKGMEYAVSVYTAAAPDPGFRFLSRWASSEDMDTKKIVAANLRKSRLAKRYPERCQEVGEVLAAGF
jgi:hypothetical protein